MSDPNAPREPGQGEDSPPEPPSSPFPESTLGQSDEPTPLPEGYEPPPPAPPTQAYSAVPPPDAAPDPPSWEPPPAEESVATPAYSTPSPPEAPESVATPAPEAPAAPEPPAYEPPPPAPPTQAYSAITPPPPPPPAPEAPPPPPPAFADPLAGGMTSGDPLGTAASTAYPPGYTSPPPPGAGGGAFAPAAGAGPQAATGNYVLAGWGRRAGAAIIDGLLIGIVATIIMVPLGIGIFATGGDGDGSGFFALVGSLILGFIVFAIIALLYAPVMMSRTNGKTVGRMVAGTRVVRASGQAMDFGTAAIREVLIKGLAVGIASSVIPLIPWLVDILWPLWDDENRALHDFPVNTRTVLD